MRVSTGVDGLDEVLHGGLPAGRNHLVRGGPGAGKTTLALHFLCAGAAHGEEGLYVSLTSPRDHILADAAAVSLDTARLSILDLSSPTSLPDDAETAIEHHLYHRDRERTPIVQAILARARSVQPRRVVVDSLTRLCELIPDVHEFRREVLALVRGLAEAGATVLGTSESSSRAPDDELQFLADGVIRLDATSAGRTVEVTKLRGSGFAHGQHTVRLTDRGVTVAPRLVPGLHAQPFSGTPLSFGVPQIDEMLHGGLEQGTMTLISGPSGSGKTTLGAQFMEEAAERGERSVLFMFDESAETFIHRCESVSIPVRSMIDRGTLALIPVEPLTHTPDEIAALVRDEVEERGATVVMIDSVASYELSVPHAGSDTLVQLHALGRYLKNRGITGLLIDEIPNLTGDFFVSHHGLSYLADTAIFLRYLEVEGQLSKAIGVLKKRTSGFEKSLRELRITSAGLEVGRPQSHLRGLLSGVPEFASSDEFPDGQASAAATRAAST